MRCVTGAATRRCGKPIYDQQRFAAPITEHPAQKDGDYRGYLAMAKDVLIGDKTRGLLRIVDRLGADALLCHG